MARVASLFLPQLPIERLRRAERPPRAPPEPAAVLLAPVDDDPGACSVPRGGGWRPGARWARDGGRAGVEERIAATREAADAMFPDGVPEAHAGQIAHELRLIESLGYAQYFLTVNSIVAESRTPAAQACENRLP